MTFTRVSNFGDDTITEIISANLVSFLDWGFIDIGAYNNVTVGTTDSAGLDYASLQPLSVPGQSAGTIWQTQRMNWVWEDGLSVGTPISISGVTIDGTLRASGDSGYEHYYDYPNGNVVFSSAKSLNSVMTINHSFKTVQVQETSSQNLFKRIQEHTLGDSINFNQEGKDEYSRYRTRIQLPWVGVEMVPGNFVRGVELGNSLEYKDLEVIFHILGDDESIITKIHDIVNGQHRRKIYLYDTNLVANSGEFPLDYRGMPITGAKTYPELTAISSDGGFRIDSYLGSSMRLFSVGSKQSMQALSNDLYYIPLRLGVEVIV